MPSYEDLRRINKANSIINRSNRDIGVRPMYLNDFEEEQQARLQEKYYQQEQFEIEEEQVDLTEELLNESSLSYQLRDEIREKVKETVQRDIVTAEEYYLEKANALESNSYFEEQILDETIDQDEFQYHQQENLKPNFFDAAELDSEPLFETAAKAKAGYQEIKSRPSDFNFSKTVLYTACGVIAAVFLIFTFKPVSTATDQNQSFEQTKLQELTQVVDSKLPRSLIITSGNFSKKASAQTYKKSLKEKLGVDLQVVEHNKTFSVQIGPAYANHDDALMVFDELSRYSVENLSIKIAS
jgi:hypothetical protein